MARYEADGKLAPALAALAAARRAELGGVAWWDHASAEEATVDEQMAVRVKMSEYLCLAAHLAALDDCRAAAGGGEGSGGALLGRAAGLRAALAAALASGHWDPPPLRVMALFRHTALAEPQFEYTLCRGYYYWLGERRSELMGKDANGDLTCSTFRYRRKWKCRAFCFSCIASSVPSCSVVEAARKTSKSQMVTSSTSRIWNARDSGRQKSRLGKDVQKAIVDALGPTAGNIQQLRNQAREMRQRLEAKKPGKDDGAASQDKSKAGLVPMGGGLRLAERPLGHRGSLAAREALRQLGDKSVCSLPLPRPELEACIRERVGRWFEVEGVAFDVGRPRGALAAALLAASGSAYPHVGLQGGGVQGENDARRFAGDTVDPSVVGNMQDGQIPASKGMAVQVSRKHAQIAEIFLGTPPQRLTCLIDSGSSDLWVPSSRCASCQNNNDFSADASSTFQAGMEEGYGGPKPRAVKITYGSGEVSGYAAQDVLTFGSVTVQAQPFIIVEDAALPEGRMWDGICGLGWKGIAQLSPTLYESLQQQGQRCSFTVCPTPAGGAYPGAGMQMLLGEVPQSLIKPETLVWVPAEAYDPTGGRLGAQRTFWMVSGGVQINAPQPFPARFLVDTGTNQVLLVPQRYYQNFIRSLIPSQYFDQAPVRTAPATGRGG
ncbi:unnamed protein product [Prorocentrum cordatum]|uniref:Peptidase A1 domain-containing protein n=1 Tax=Prorocentrum cordatum TaxID=2364126 RepID=A0ABN9TAT6_9DINO|nr:unnamed protein product [Polarella glacialis]